MIHLAAGFVILASSIAGLAVLIACAVLAFFEQIRPSFKYGTFGKIAISLSICYGFNFVVYCIEVAPCLLFQGLIYGRLLHIASGWISVTSHYCSILHIFLLSVFKIDSVYQSESKSNVSIIFVWFVSGGFSALIMNRACSYTFSIQSILYRCENSSNTPRFLIVYATLSSAILLLSAISALYRYFGEKGLNIKKRDDQPIINELQSIRKNRAKLVGHELLLAASKMIGTTLATTFSNKMVIWHGLIITICLIILEIIAVWLYFRSMTKLSTMYGRVEEMRRKNGRSVSFGRTRRSRSCQRRSSAGSRHSRQIISIMSGGPIRNRVYPLNVETVERDADEIAGGVVRQNGVTRAQINCDDEESIDQNGQGTYRLRQVPVVQVQVYRSCGGDVSSLCNYCSDSECSGSLKERSLSALDTATPNISPRCYCIPDSDGTSRWGDEHENVVNAQRKDQFLSV